MEIEALDSPHSPYFVNATDFHVSALVSPELGDGNYASWRRSFELALSIKNKVSFVDGTIVKPAADNPLFSAWRRCDNLVKSWIQR
ncbi:hypothetical protein MLD38_035840 [Melastoma candidum]|nr:hypothetical protein MLD38_035840 [Melastoma candidum]